MDPKSVKQVAHSMTKEMRDIMEEYVSLMSRIAPRASLCWAL